MNGKNEKTREGLLDELERLRRRVEELEEGDARLDTYLLGLHDNRLLSLLLDRCPVSIMAFDESGTVTFVNRWHRQTFARHRQDGNSFAGCRIFELPEIVKAGIGRQLKGVLRGDEVELDQVRFPEFADGRDGYVNVRGVPIRQNGRILGGVLIREDVSRLCRAEGNVRQDPGELEDRIRERTRELEAANRVLEEQILEREKAEAALREREELFRTVFDASPIGIAMVSLEGFRLLEANRSYCDLLGYSRSELQQLTLADFTHPDDLEENLRLQGMLGRGEISVFDMEKRFIRKDGSIARGYLLATLVHDANGQRSHFLGQVVDITKRTDAEQKLRQANEHLQLIADNLPAFLAHIGRDRRCLFANSFLGALAGVPASTLVGKHMREVLGEEYYSQVRPHVDEALRGRQVSFDSVIRRPNGDECHARVAHVPCVDVEGKVDGFIALGMDVTQHKRAQTALRESHERFLTVLDSIDAHIYTADLKTHEILFMNRKMQEDFGGNHVGEICWQVFRGEGGVCGHCTNGQLLDEEGRPAGVCIWEGQNPITRRWYIYYDRAIKWIDGRNVRLQVATDITKIKELEEERRQTETQLRQAQKMEAIGTLAGGIAHDFNNILAAIIGYSELTLDDLPHGSPAYANLQHVLSAGQRAKELVQQILTFSRQTEQEAKPVRISSVVREGLKLLRASLPTTIDIQSNVPRELPLVLADITQIHQVVMNLCTNAAHAMRRRGGVLEIRVEEVSLAAAAVGAARHLTAGQCLCLHVRDTGHGMPPEVLERIFDPFFTTKKKGEGTGMGLSVVHGIVKAHGGAVQVSSEVGVGTTFRVYLPTVTATREETHREDEPLLLGREKILFIDDDAVLVDLGRQMLTRLGYTVEGRTSPVDALELFRERPDAFDLVITDQTMPNMTGVELAQQMLALRPGMPIILCTGFSEIITEERAKQSGIREFLLKPLVMHDLADSIRGVLDGFSEGGLDCS